MNKELAIEMLAAVKKPARYTGGEFGSVFKEEAEVSIPGNIWEIIIFEQTNNIKNN